ncbi:hypothetical protein SAMN04487967_1059 [Natronorubrum sediminis]|uniref:Uncharacterized protein n=1 Tax=Natronorubrum sediminis TaxID=640943 RepID=A0A1H6FT53_9EURY|nr:hypothetical protein [Natronorubrum sediminis]SEH12965.1 hypothetical protein SAMN04487967_1059 [Natronorubrum sediminis]
MTPNRRDVLEFAAATATATVATAGTTGSLTVATQEGSEEPPAYTEWLTLEDGALEFAYLDWATIDDYVGDELAEAEPDDEVPAEYEADPMIAPVSEGALSTYFFVGLDLGQYRLGGILDDDDAFDSSVSDLVQTPETFVVIGSIEPAEIDERLTADPEAEFIRQLERTDEIGGYDVYTPVEGSEEAAIAVGSDAFVVTDAGDPLAALETTIDASEGDVERATDESETFEWTAASAGGGDAVVGQVGGGVQADENGAFVDFSFEGLEDAESIVSSLTVEDEGTSTGTFAAVIDDPDEATLEETLGTTGANRSVDIDGDRVTATATWEEEGVAVD